MAQRDLRAQRAPGRVVFAQPNFALPPGMRFFIEGHAREDLEGELVVVSCSFSLDDGLSLPGEASRAPRRSYQAAAVRAAEDWLPARAPKPHALAPEPAFVVGHGAAGQVDVDAEGRVLLEFLWDRRDLRQGQVSRRVRVSQAWAGVHLGFMALPRIGDEVVVAYYGGDPDQPIVVGRVHNAVAVPPLDLPEPDRTVSAWRSRTLGGDGYNMVLMDDAPGGERLWLRAERDYRLHVLRHAATQIDGDAAVKVGGDARLEVAKQLSVDSGGFDMITGPAELRATSGEVRVRDALSVEADTIRLEAGQKLELICGGSRLVLEPGGATLSGGKASIRGGSIEIKADGTVDVDGALITLN